MLIVTLFFSLRQANINKQSLEIDKLQNEYNKKQLEINREYLSIFEDHNKILNFLVQREENSLDIELPENSDDIEICYTNTKTKERNCVPLNDIPLNE